MSTDFASSGSIPVTVYPMGYPAEVRVPASAYNWEGFRAWAVSDDYPDRGKITFAGGELIIDMSPESFEEQGAVKSEICRVLTQFIREQRLGYYRIDRTLISNKLAGLSAEPDSLFLFQRTIDSGRVAFTPEAGRPQSSKEIVGSVDWVLEIVSPSSKRKDERILRDAYFKASIPEYWLIDVLGDEIDFKILVPGDAGYIAVTPLEGWIASPTFDRQFRLYRQRDEKGYWEYTLEMQEG